MSDKLKPKHEQFCLEYLKNGNNGTQAYKAVYGTKKDNTARINATKLLTKANIKAFLTTKCTEITTKKQKEHEINLDTIINDFKFYKDMLLDVAKKAHEDKDYRATTNAVKVASEQTVHIAYYLGIKPIDPTIEDPADHELIYKERLQSKKGKTRGDKC